MQLGQSKVELAEKRPLKMLSHVKRELKIEKVQKTPGGSRGGGVQRKKKR